jgi:23S rRNA pseudouridine2457 synthase
MRTILLNKPYGHLSQFTSEGGHPGLADLVDVPGVYAAGRLDHDSEGLLLLTADNRLKLRLTDPKFEHPKTYWAQVEGLPTAAALKALCEGVLVQGQVTRPAEAVLLPGEPDLPPRDPPVRYRAAIPTAWIALTLREGRNRQVRRMTAAVGFSTLRLVRAAIGPLSLDGLAPGSWRDLSPEERLTLERMLKN